MRSRRFAKFNLRQFFKKFTTGGTLSLVAKIIFFGLIIGTVLTIGVFAWFARDLPDPNTIKRQDGFTTQILDRTGQVVLYNVYQDQNRRFTSINEVPDYLKKAVVAVEDKDFYKHQGFDPLAALRIVKNLIVKHRLIGGSTLTQQLVKNVLLNNERRISRKIKELVLAIEIERRFTKDEILQMYLNEAPYGGTAWGIAAAAQTYFGKKPSDLSLTEAVILAGMPQSPSHYSPYGKSPLAFVQRSTDVARRMREDGYITADQEKDIVSNLTTVKFQPAGGTFKAPHFVMYVKDQLENTYGEALVERGGLKVTTTLDWNLQQQAEKIVGEEIDKVAGPLHITNGASIILDTNSGDILSMVGSRNFFDNAQDGQFNVVLGNRQPGSSIKPVTYATAFAKGFWPGRVIADTITEFPSGDPKKPYIPLDYDNKEHGLVHLRDALGSSLNIPAVKLLSLVGLKDMLEMAHKMGFTTLEPTADNMRKFGLSVTLGGGEVRPLDLVSAYSAFANGGYKIQPVSILKIEDNKGNVLFERQDAGKQQILDSKVAFLINNILSDNKARLLTFGPNSLLNFTGRSIAVKTGTTNDRRDNWAVGWTKKAIVGVWVGNNDYTPMKQVASGVSGASPIWRREMLEVVNKQKDEPFDQPSGISPVDLDNVSGYPAHDNLPSYKEWVIDGTLPTEEDPIHIMLPVCSTDPAKKATQVQVAQGNFSKAEFIIVAESDPLTPNNLWQKGIDTWLAKVDDKRFHPPTVYCSDTTGVHVEIRSPLDRSRVNSNDINIRAEVFSDQPIQWADLYLDGNKELRWDNPPFEHTYHLDNGQHTVRVVAHNAAGVESDRISQFGVNQDWQAPTQATTSGATP